MLQGKGETFKKVYEDLFFLKDPLSILFCNSFLGSL